MTLKLPATTLVANCASATLFDATSAKVDRSGLEAAFRTIYAGQATIQIATG
jgi:hypothetical protein